MKHSVTLFKNNKTVKVGYNRDVNYALERIKNGKSKDIIEQIREGKKELKSSLPAVCFNGTFRHRADSGLIEHSGLCILDFDKFTSEELKTWRDTLESCEYVFSCWLSPSGDGIKALIRIPREPDNHKLYFDAIREYFECENIDSGSDLSRLCYESYDPDIYINHESTIWIDKAVEDIEDVGTYEPVIAVESEHRIIDNLLTWWRKKYGSTKGERNNNLFKLAVAFNDFGVDKTEAERVLLQFQEKDFNSSEILSICRSAYKNVSNHATKFFEDTDTASKIEKQIRTGKKLIEIERRFSNIPKEKLLESIDRIKNDLSISDFWQYQNNGNIKLLPHKYKYWLEQHNFFKYYPSDGNTYTFIHKDQNLLEETDEKRIKDYVLDYLLSRGDIGYAPYDFMANNPRYFSSEFLSFLETSEVKVKEDTQDVCYIYFKNCIVEVTKDNIKEVDYVDVDSFVWKQQIIDYDFKKVDHHKAEFRTFLWKIAGEDKQRYNSLKSVIGYLLHSFKTSANNKAIIFNDETISENPNGGSGKGLFWNAISKLKRVASIDGKTFEFTKSFPYQTVSTDTQLLVFDDVKRNFNFESLFSLITEGITLEYKGQNAIKLPVERSPKILITTNYTVGGSGGSFERRKFEVELSGYFNASHTPIDEFGHLLFDDWDPSEWNRFYSFMLNCCQYYLENGLQTYDHKNLKTRKFIKDTCHEFYEWVKDDNLPINVQIDKKEKYTEFMEEHKDFRWLTQRTFTRWIETWAKYKGWETVTGRTHNMRWIMINDREIDKELTDN